MTTAARTPAVDRQRRFSSLSTGQRVILAYFAVAYFIPLVAHAVATEELLSRPEAIYAIAPVTNLALLQLFAVCALFLVFSSFRKRSAASTKPSLSANLLRSVGGYYTKWRLLFAFFTLGSGIIYFATGMNNFRYSTLSISESGSWLLVFVNITRLVVSVDLFFVMFCSADDVDPLFSRRYLENLVMSLALIVSANGTVSMFMALITTAYCVFAAAFRRLLFVPLSEPRMQRTARSVTLAVAVAVVFGLAWITGESIKGSADGAVDPIQASAAVFDRVNASEDFAIDYFFYLISSVSTHYYSWLFTASADRELLNQGSVSPIMFPLQTLLFRLDYLLGSPFNVVRPDIGSLSRLNYLVIRAGAFNDREGSSPGLLASFNYVFGVPFNIVFATAYLYWMSSRFDLMFRSTPARRLSTGGVCLAVFFLAGVFQSPLDFVMVFDDVVVYMLLIFGLSYAYIPVPRQARQPKRVWQPRRPPVPPLAASGARSY